MEFDLAEIKKQLAVRREAMQCRTAEQIKLDSLLDLLEQNAVLTYHTIRTAPTITDARLARLAYDAIRQKISEIIGQRFSARETEK